MILENIKPIVLNKNIKNQNPNILVTFTPSKDKHIGDQGFHHLIASSVFIFKEDLELIQRHGLRTKIFTTIKILVIYKI